MDIQPTTINFLKKIIIHFKNDTVFQNSEPNVF